MIEQSLQAQLDPFFVGHGNDGDRAQAVSAQFEEIIRDSKTADRQHFRHDPAENLLLLCTGRDVFPLLRVDIRDRQVLPVRLSARCHGHMFQPHEIVRHHILGELSGQAPAHFLFIDRFRRSVVAG